jgi:hypothetical protein
MRLLVLVLGATLACCASPEPYPVHDTEGRSLAADPNSCMASVVARRYVHEMRQQVLEAWQPPARGRGGPSSVVVVVVVRLNASGELQDVYTEPPEDPFKTSAVAAFWRAAPFSPIPWEASCLTEQFFQARFELEGR